MHNIIFILITSFFSLSAQSQNPTFQWAKSFGSTFGDEGNTILKDAIGNIYVMGGFWGL